MALRPFEAREEICAIGTAEIEDRVPKALDAPLSGRKSVAAPGVDPNPSIGKLRSQRRRVGYVTATDISELAKDETGSVAIDPLTAREFRPFAERQRNLDIVGVEPFDLLVKICELLSHPRVDLDDVDGVGLMVVEHLHVEEGVIEAQRGDESGGDVAHPRLNVGR